MNRLLGCFLLSVFLTSALILSLNFDPVFAEDKEISSKIFSFENTSIIQFTNQGTEDLKSFRIWLTDFSVKSVKSETGWSVQNTPEQVLIFTAIEPLKSGEKVKFGIKTDTPKPDINWKGIDQEGTLIASGKALSEPISTTLSPGILPESNFRIIPENPSVGSTIRVTGDSFVSNSNLKLFLNENKLKSFQTDENGHFMLTIQISQNQNPERINFIIKDQQGKDKTISLQLNEAKEKISISEISHLTASLISDQFYRDEKLEISGSAKPASTITLSIKNSLGEFFLTDTINVDSKGNWHYSLIIPPDTSLGAYTLEINDGVDTIIKNWSVDLAKKIHIFPSKQKFTFGEVLIFNATANPNENIKIILEDPQGRTVLSDNFRVLGSNHFEIKYQTQSTSIAGTYTLFAFQNNEVEIVTVGLDEFPKNELSAKMDKVNYKIGESALIALTGQPSKALEFLIEDQNSFEKFKETITLGSDGKKNYHLNLELIPGIYNAVISMSDHQTTEVFTVGLQPSFLEIDLEIAKKVYSPGQSILVLGKSASNSAVDLLLINPEGNLIKKSESFTNSQGNLFLEDTWIPFDATFGKWVFRAESGPFSTNIEFLVTPEQEEIWVGVTDIYSTLTAKFVTIEGVGAAEHSFKITVSDPEEQNIWESSIITTKDGEFRLLWEIPKDAVSGTYSVTVDDLNGNTASTTFTL
ncbi:MAG: conserved exported protein of unknown function [Nitrosopumilales archaeon]|nr:MAG: conserved exported protein of unknown function [Nitrosopumilales archaeon]